MSCSLDKTRQLLIDKNLIDNSNRIINRKGKEESYSKTMQSIQNLAKEKYGVIPSEIGFPTTSLGGIVKFNETYFNWIDARNSEIEKGGSQQLLFADLSSKNLIKNVKFNIDENIRQYYQSDSNMETTIKRTIENPRILWQLQEGDSSRFRQFLSFGLPTETSGEYKVLRATNFKNSAFNKEVLQYTGEDLWRNLSKEDSIQTSTMLSMFIAQRLLQQSDKFTGRILANPSNNTQLAGDVSIRDNKESALFSADSYGIYINISKLHEFSSRFNSYEDFSKGLELILSEEAIHYLFSNQISNSDVNYIFKNLSKEEIENITRVYSGLKKLDKNSEQYKNTLVHEFLRKTIQENHFNTYSEVETFKQNIEGIIKKTWNKVLQLINNIFKGNISNSAQEYINNFENKLNNILSEDNKLELQSDEYFNSVRDNFNTLNYNEQNNILGENDKYNNIKLDNAGDMLLDPDDLEEYNKKCK
jgi:hypothetical protein